MNHERRLRRLEHLRQGPPDTPDAPPLTIAERACIAARVILAIDRRGLADVPEDLRELAQRLIEAQASGDSAPASAPATPAPATIVAVDWWLTSDEQGQERSEAAPPLSPAQDIIPAGTVEALAPAVLDAVRRWLTYDAQGRERTAPPQGPGWALATLLRQCFVAAA